MLFSMRILFPLLTPPHLLTSTLSSTSIPSSTTFSATPGLDDLFHTMCSPIAFDRAMCSTVDSACATHGPVAAACATRGHVASARAMRGPASLTTYGSLRQSCPHLSVACVVRSTDPSSNEPPRALVCSFNETSVHHLVAIHRDPCHVHHMVQRRSTGDRLVLTTATSSAPSSIPSSVRTTPVDPHWRRAMEYVALLANHTWDLVSCPPNTNVVTEKWIFLHKLKANGFLDRDKARWALRGITQRPRVEYDETFNPIVKPATVRTAHFLALSRDWAVHQLDTKNAFLHGTLAETMYCNQPVGFVYSTHPGMVCKLNHSLYGLKQAPWA